MKAEILAVGTELLMGHTVNTNAAEIARMLAEIGVGVYYQTVVGDNPERLEEAVHTAVARAELVVACGGLGPTEDDLTRETVASVLGLELVRNERWAQRLMQFFERRGRVPTENNFRQALVPVGAELLENEHGTAPGIFLTHRGVTVVLLPGPPHEMRALMHDHVLPRLSQALEGESGTAVLVSRVLRVVGLGESRMVEALEPILSSQSNPTIAPLAKSAEVHLRITSRAETRAAAEELNERCAQQIYERLGPAIYGEDEVTLEEAVGRLLRQQGLSLATAESCTGGLIGHRVTNVAGSSAYYLGGIVAYSNSLKAAGLGVDPALIERDGAVSEAVARAMATGVRERTDAGVGLSVTGIAGPGGGSEDKPVGLTYIAIASAAEVQCVRREFWGGREQVKLRAAQAALEFLRRHLLGTVSA